MLGRKKSTCQKIEVASILLVYPKRFLRYLVKLYMEAYVFFLAENLLHIQENGP